MINDDDYIVDDLAFETKKKRLNSGRKGKGAERDLSKIFEERFGQTFHRTVGSGNRGSQVSLSEREKSVFSGDIVCPDGPNEGGFFSFTIEVKCGYDDIDLFLCLSGKCKQFDEFLTQATKASEIAGKEPLLCWRKTRKPWVVFFKKKTNIATPVLTYGSWMGCSLDSFLSLPNNFFFK